MNSQNSLLKTPQTPSIIYYIDWLNLTYTIKQTQPNMQLTAWALCVVNAELVVKEFAYTKLAACTSWAVRSNHALSICWRFALATLKALQRWRTIAIIIAEGAPIFALVGLFQEDLSRETAQFGHAPVVDAKLILWIRYKGYFVKWYGLRIIKAKQTMITYKGHLVKMGRYDLVVTSLWLHRVDWEIIGYRLL